MRQRTGFVRLVQPRRAFHEFPLFLAFKALVCYIHCCVFSSLPTRSFFLEKQQQAFGIDTTCVAHEHDRMGFYFLWRFGFSASEAVDLTALRLTGLLRGSCRVPWFSFSFSTRVGIRTGVGLASVFTFCAVLLEWKFYYITTCR